MKILGNLFVCFLLIAAGMLQACDGEVQEKEEEFEKAILVFSKTAGFRHQSISAGIAAIQKLAQEHQVQVTATEDAAYFVADSLRKFKAVVFLNTTGDVLNEAQQDAFERYIKAGGGYAGIHAASDTEYDWPWYNRLVGAYFESHPAIQPADILVINKNHPSTSHLPDKWERTDEWYNFKSMNPDVTVLANLDEETYDGGKNGSHHPIAWYHAYDGGRAFYTALGHTPESYEEPLFLQHIWGGIRYAMGEE